MAQPYVGEIRLFAGNFAPAGWMFCEGQLLPISENETLFQLIGTTYGGDGEETFGVPDLRGRVPVHQGSGYVLAEAAGVEEVTLTTQQIPVHNHAYIVSTAAGANSDLSNQVIGQHPTISIFQAAAPTVTMNPAVLGPVGGSQPHTNFQPYLCINYIISLFGIFPSPT
jgi:microcystin-dependent protein